jgi:spore cortex formation protein SpoVR/YcgB (stage V sporulation)
MARTEVIERVARVLTRKVGARVFGAEHADWYENNYWLRYLDDARAVIEVLRDPTDAMLKDGHEARTSTGDGEKIWQAMIDAALAEPKSR